MNTVKHLPRINVHIDPAVLFERIKIMEQKIDHLSDHNKTLKINCCHGMEIIPFDEILYCKADSNYCKIHLVNKKSIYVSKTLKYIMDRLPSSFIRPHHSFVVNKHQVRRIQSAPEKGLLLSTGILIPISRNKKQQIENHF